MAEIKGLIQVIQLNPGDLLILKHKGELADSQLNELTNYFADWLDEIGLESIHLTVMDEKLDLAIVRPPEEKYSVVIKEEEDDWNDILGREL